MDELFLYCYILIYPDVQEFLTAVHICLTWEPQDIDKITQLNVYINDFDNEQLFIGGLLGDEVLGHRLLTDLITNNSNRNFSDDAKTFITRCCHRTTHHNELSKIQSICCAHQGMNASLLQEATKDIENWRVWIPMKESFQPKHMKLLHSHGFKGDTDCHNSRVT